MQDKIPGEKKKKIKTKYFSSSDEKSITLQGMEEMDTMNEFINSYNANFSPTETHHLQHNKFYFFSAYWLSSLLTCLQTPYWLAPNLIQHSLFLLFIFR